MTRLSVALVAASLVTVVAWLAWFKRATHEEESEAPATEVPVSVARIMRATLRGYITAYGTVEPEPPGKRPAASAHVMTAVPGIIVSVHCVEGQRVEKGVVLFELDSRATDVAVEFAEKTLERQQRLIQSEATSQKALQDAEAQLAAARAQQTWLTIRSPLAGTLVRVNGKPGEAADLAIPMADVVDLDRLVVSMRVPDMELTGLKAGQVAEVIADKSLSPVAGSITFIGSEIDPHTGTALARASLPAGSGLRPGQFVKVRIVSAEHSDCLAVPIESVVKNEDGATVIAIVKYDSAVQKQVTTGLRDNGWVEVEADGLQTGMTVVTEGAYGLPQETKVRVLK